MLLQWVKQRRVVCLGRMCPKKMTGGKKMPLENFAAVLFG
jgi:hypothetical protein